MGDTFHNTYEDALRAAAYADLEYPGTYHLAFRDLPQILKAHVCGKRALDFGCGTGRSTRFLQNLGFTVIGVDISVEMLRLAREHDPKGNYLLVNPGEPIEVELASMDLVLAAFPFDNIATALTKISLFMELGRLLRPTGRIINLVSSPEIYVNEWLSFSTRAFPENRMAVSGDVVRVVMLDVPDSRPVEDILWTHEDYLDVYHEAGLEMEAVYRPLGRDDEDYPWVTELTAAPWAIYVLRRSCPEE
jgi:SAM-dependent methyltransferase